MNISERGNAMTGPLKTALILLVGAMLLAAAGCASAEPQLNENADAGATAVHDTSRANALFPDCGFSPLQIGLWDKQLVGRSADCLLILNPLVLFTDQSSGIVSVTGVGADLDCNYGILCGLGTVVRHANYGLMCGIVPVTKGKNYGIQIGVLTATRPLTDRMQAQVCGINVADRLRIGVVNVGDSEESPWLDLGVINAGRSTFLQIGLSNYNEHAPIPWLPIINFCFDRNDDGK